MQGELVVKVSCSDPVEGETFEHSSKIASGTIRINRVQAKQVMNAIGKFLERTK